MPRTDHQPLQRLDGSALPGDDLVHELRRRICQLVLGDGPGTEPAARLGDRLHLWSAFDRSWLARLLPHSDGVASPDEDDEAPPSERPDLDPRSRDGRRLQLVWMEVIDELLRRGRALNGANLLPCGVEELTTDVYLVAARRWPEFEYRDHEQTVRWLISILHNLLRRAIDRAYHAEAVPLPGDPSLLPVSDLSRSLGTRSRAEERELMAARVLILHGLVPSECRAPDLAQRVVGQPTLQLFVAAETLETVLRLSPEDCRQWTLLAVRQMESAEVARLVGIRVSHLNVRFHRHRTTAIGLLAGCWAESLAQGN